MADGDYERGRGREIAAITAYLRRRAASHVLAAKSSRPRVLVLNGWAASPHAWDLCAFRRDRLFSYVDQLDGLPESCLAADGGGADPSGASSSAMSVLVGWSMGGSSALRLACRFPERVAGLVLLAATPRMMEDPTTSWRGMNARRLEALRKGLELTRGEGFFGVPDGMPNPYMVDSSERLERGLEYLLETDIRPELERVFRLSVRRATFPVYVFQSERDGIVRSENATYLQTLFPHARVLLVPGTEHALPIQIPKEIDNAVDACLSVASQG